MRQRNGSAAYVAVRLVRDKLLAFAAWVVLGVAIGASGTGAAQAQDKVAGFPSRPVKLVVPYPGGNLPDAVARILATQLGDSLGQAFVVDNRPGAGGVVAIDAVTKSIPDGHTLLFGDPGPIVIAPAQNRAMLQSVTRDLVPVSLLGTSHFFLVVPASLGVSSLSEFIALAKARPGTLNYASTGPGGIHHLMMETLKADAGIDVVHVPYKGGPQGVVGLLGGEVSVMFSSLSAITSQVKGGTLKVLAVASPRRAVLYPDVPSFAELGYPGMNFRGDFGIFAPAGTPVPVIRSLAAAVRNAVLDAKVTERLNGLGVEPIGSTPEAAAAYWKAEGEKYAKAVRLVGLEPN